MCSLLIGQMTKKALRSGLNCINKNILKLVSNLLYIQYKYINKIHIIFVKLRKYDFSGC